MNIQSTQIILYVSDQRAATAFYTRLLQRNPILDVPGMTEFELLPQSKLGLMPNDGIAKILSGKTPHPATANGIPRCELYLLTDDVFQAFAHATTLGAVMVSPVQLRDWGHNVGYLMDADGHIIALAGR